MLRIVNTSTAILHLDRPFLSVKVAVLNCAWSLGLQYGVSFAKVRSKKFEVDMMPPIYLSRGPLSSNVRYVRFGRLIKRNSGVFPLLESLDES